MEPVNQNPDGTSRDFASDQGEFTQDRPRTVVEDERPEPAPFTQDNPDTIEEDEGQADVGHSQAEVNYQNDIPSPAAPVANDQSPAAPQQADSTDGDGVVTPDSPEEVSEPFSPENPPEANENSYGNSYPQSDLSK